MAQPPNIEESTDVGGTVPAEEVVQQRHHEELVHSDERIVRRSDDKRVAASLLISAVDDVTDRGGEFSLDPAQYGFDMERDVVTRSGLAHQI